MRRLAAAVAVIAAAAVVGPWAGAQAPKASGWWWKVESGPLAVLPAPPVVPDGGLFVAGAPDGATAVSALRFEDVPEDGPPVLTLKVSGGVGADSAVVGACRAEPGWKAGGSGAWEQRPIAECEKGTVAGTRSADGKAYTFDLAPLVTAGIADVVITPGKVQGAPPGADGSTFQLAFERPGADALTVANGAPAPPAGGAPAVEVVGSEPASSPAASSPPVDLGAAGPVASFDPAPLPAPDAAAAPAATVPAPFSPSVGASPRASSTAAAAEDEGGLTGRDRFLGGVVVALALLGAAIATRQPIPPIRGLGRFARPLADVAPAVGGLGRFARPRAGSPPPL